MGSPDFCYWRMKRSMNFYVQRAVLDAGVKILFAAVYGIDNHGEDPEWAVYRDNRLQELASENLIKLLKKNHGMFYINQAVDIYNLISLESKLALGAHNIDRVEGDFTLRFTDGTERFVPIGQTGPVPVAPHEYSYCDDANEVLCRLEIRQVEKTKVDEDATNVCYIVQGNKATTDSLLLETAQRIVDLTVKYCGGRGEVIVPTVKE